MELFDKIKNKGVRGTFRSIKEKILTISHGYQLDLTKYNSTSGKEVYSYRLLRMNIAHLTSVKNLYSDELSDNKYKILEERILHSQVHLPYVVEDEEGNICGYFHIAHGETRDGTINSNIKVNDGSVYLFDDYTFIDKRGKGVHKFSVLSRLELAKELNCSIAIVNILSNNMYSKRTYISIGFNKCISYYYIHFSKFRKTISKNSHVANV
ncbi:hypothetical protein ACW4EZ_26815 [Bacillus toyonensis]